VIGNLVTASLLWLIARSGGLVSGHPLITWAAGGILTGMLIMIGLVAATAPKGSLTPLARIASAGTYILAAVATSSGVLLAIWLARNGLDP
jgi:cation transporter-like permease